MYQGVMPAAELYRNSMGSRLNATQGISWTAYDTETYVTAATLQLRFFVTVKANRLLSNMAHPGAFPHPNAMHVFAIRIVPKVPPRLATASPFPEEEVYRLVFESHAVLKVGDKEFGVWPSFVLPGGAGVWAQNAAAGGEAADEFLSVASNGFPVPGAIYTLIEPIQIDPMIQFEFQMNWQAAQTLGANRDITVLLDGRLLRPVQ